MVGSAHLTDESVSWIMTQPGQAHFARVDTVNTCRECLHWANKMGELDPKGLLKPARCLKAAQFARAMPEVPHRAWACKHFEENPTPPPI